MVRIVLALLKAGIAEGMYNLSLTSPRHFYIQIGWSVYSQAVEIRYTLIEQSNILLKQLAGLDCGLLVYQRCFYG